MVINEIIGYIGVLLMLMVLLVSIGGIIECFGLLEMLFEVFLLIWVVMGILVVIMVIIGMIMDFYGVVIFVNVIIV